MPLIKPYTDSDLEDEPEENKQNKKFDGDDEDARAKSFHSTILPDNMEADEDKPDESDQNKYYSADKFDEGREPFKITILPYDEENDEGGADYIGYPHARFNIRYPCRRPWPPATH